MKVAHVPFVFTPDPIGGTEVYVTDLAKALRLRETESIVVVPGVQTEAYEVEGIPVRRFAVSANVGLDALYGEGDAAAALNFGAILDAERPDLVHFHAFTSANSLLSVRQARQRGLPVLFTYHTPTVTCGRGTLLELGSSVCDGYMAPLRCAKCTLHGLGLPLSVASVAAQFPAPLIRQVEKLGLASGIWTALRMRALQELRQKAVREFLNLCDRIVVPAKWVGDVLTLNGVAADRIAFCRQGVGPYGAGGRAAAGEGSGPLRLAWLGRLHPTKGLHILLEAFAMMPDVQIELDAFPILQGANDAPYVSGIRESASKDRRIRLLAAIEPARVVHTLAEYEALAVPSQWLETGPLVVLEAFAAGIPVIGSDLGGIAELVADGKDGVLVDPSRPRAWSEALSRLATNRPALAALTSGVSPPRTMDSVAAETGKIYEELIGAARRKGMHPWG